MTPERAAEFGGAWNSHDADLVTGYFTDDGAYMRRWDLMPSVRATSGRKISVAGCRLSSTDFPMGNSKT